MSACAQSAEVVQHSVAHQLNRVSGEKEGDRMSFFDSCLCHQEGEGCPGGMLRAVREVNQCFCYVTPPGSQV
jgi:hypothetical protein